MAMTPTSTGDTEQEKKMVNRCIKRYQGLKSQRVNWDTHWDEVSRYTIPNKDNVFGERPKGEKKTNKIFDSTAIQANELLASAMHSMLSNPISQFFELSTGDEGMDRNDIIRTWFEDTERKMLNALNNSNFQTEIHETYLDLGSFGTNTLFIDEDDKFGVRFQSRPIFESYVDENAKGIVDVAFRKYKWTLKKVVEEWGIDKLDPKTQRSLQNNPRKEFEEVEILHCVEPRKGMGKFAVGSKKPFASIYILLKEKKLLSNSGFNEFPYAVPRFSKISGEIYGRSPAMKSLPDIKMLNEVMKVTIQSAQQTVRPSLQVPDDGIIMPVKMFPGSLNYYRAGTKDRIEPILTGARVDFGFQMIEGLRATVKSAFFLDQLELAEGPQMTATEVLQRTENQLRMMGPLLGRLQFELLEPMINRVFNILFRKGVFLDPPEELGEIKNLSVRYTSQIVRAQRTQESENLMRAIGALTPLAEVDPSILDNIENDEVVRHVFRLHGVPQPILRNSDDVAELREDRAAQQEQQAQNEQDLIDAEKVQKTAPALAQVQ